MRKLSLLAAVAVTALATSSATSSHASVMTIGGGYATACYQSAKHQNARQQALDECDHALSQEALVNSDRAATLINRGILHLRRENLRAAGADFDAALRIDPRQPEAWLNKAIMQVRHGKAAPAMPFVAHALEYGTKRPSLAYFVRAMAYEDDGNLRAAYNDLQRARDLDPDWDQPAIELRRYRVNGRS